VAGKAFFMQSFMARFSISEIAEPPSASSGIFLGVFHHDLQIHGSACDESLIPAKYFVVFIR